MGVESRDVLSDNDLRHHPDVRVVPGLLQAAAANPLPPAAEVGFMRVVSPLFRSAVVAGCTLGTLACSDASVTPAGPLAFAGVERADGPLLDTWGSGTGDAARGSFTFAIDPLRGYALHFGEHELRLPAGSICEPGRTAYGVAHWDEPCDVATRPIVFTVTYETADGRARMRVQPDVRFAPTADPTRWVVLTMKAQDAIDVTQRYNILWLNEGAWVDESRTDPALLPWTDGATGTVARRLKHFSGYSVTAGRTGAGDEGDGGESGY